MKRNESKGRSERSGERYSKRPRLTMALEGGAVTGARRRRWFRVVALSLPLLGLVLVELGLRWVGYGYPTAYFLKTQTEAGRVWLVNQDYTRRFFPPSLVRTPQPMALPVEKKAGTVRFFVFGESAAMGDPAPAYGFSRILQVLLEARFPGRQIEMANVATTAINSHVLREMARDCAPREGDVWIVYMGNNEVVGPFGAGTVFSDAVPSLGMIRAQLAFQTLRLGQCLSAFRNRFNPAAPVPDQWEGMEMFLDRQVPHDDPAMEVVYHHFERNLEEIIDLGVRSGARVLVSTVVANLKDCPPFGSLPAEPWTPERQAQWDRLVAEGDAFAAAQEPGPALARYQEAEHLEAGPAALQFRLGRAYLDLQDFQEAKSALEKARDLDTLRFRVDSKMNTIIRQTAVRQAGEAVQLFDAEEVFARQYPHRITGEEFLYEHVHLNFEGNYLLALSMAQSLVPWLKDEAAGDAPGLWLSAAECARRLALTDADRARILEEVWQRLQQPPFLHQGGHEARQNALGTRLATLQKRLTPEAGEAAREMYREALARAPDDPVLHEQFAVLLEEQLQWPEALAQWTWVLGRLPNHVQARYHRANLLDKLGQSQEALPEFLALFRQRPGMVEVRNGLALALDNLNRREEAVALLRDTVALKPDFLEARINLGQILARSGQLEEACLQYEAVLARRSNSIPAHVNLARLLADQGNVTEAESHYRQALQIDPHHAVAHFNLGNLLAGRSDQEAAAHYAAAVAAAPDFPEARLNWGLSLAEAGRAQEALEQLQEAVRLRPDWSDAQLNLGVALARAGRLEEAAGCFRETLRLEPGNEVAARYLQQAEARLPR